ncbi:hypothetical protein JCM5296_002452 [Sporobolomyces johnsonii]
MQQQHWTPEGEGPPPSYAFPPGALQPFAAAHVASPHQHHPHQAMTHAVASDFLPTVHQPVYFTPAPAPSQASATFLAGGEAPSAHEASYASHLYGMPSTYTPPQHPQDSSQLQATVASTAPLNSSRHLYPPSYIPSHQSYFPHPQHSYTSQDESTSSPPIRLTDFPPRLALHHGQLGYPHPVPHAVSSRSQLNYHSEQPPHQYPPQGFQSLASPTHHSTFLVPATFSTGDFAPSPSTSSVPRTSLQRVAGAYHVIAPFEDSYEPNRQEADPVTSSGFPSARSSEPALQSLPASRPPSLAPREAHLQSSSQTASPAMCMTSCDPASTTSPRQLFALTPMSFAQPPSHPTFPFVVPVPSLASPSPSSRAPVGAIQDVLDYPPSRSELAVQRSPPSPSADEDAEGETVDEEEAEPGQSSRHPELKAVEDALMALMEQSTESAADGSPLSPPLSLEQPSQRAKKCVGRSYSSTSEDFDEVEEEKEEKEEKEDDDDDQYDEYIPPSVKRKGPSTSSPKRKSFPRPPPAPQASTSTARPSLSRDLRPSVDVGSSGTWESETEFFSAFETKTELLDEKGVSAAFTPELTTPSSFTYDESLSCWLTYRRNFITLSASLALPASLDLAALHTSTNVLPISHFEVGLTSMTFPKGTNVELLQFDATRSLPKAKTLGRQQLVSVSSKPSQSCATPSRRTLQRSSSSSSDSEMPYMTTFTRVQYRHSTANHPSGSNTADDARFVVRATLFAVHADGSETTLGTWGSAKLVVRGRSPGSFEKTKKKREGGAVVDVESGTTKRRKVSSQAGQAKGDGEEDHPAQASNFASGSVIGLEDFDPDSLGIGGRTRRKTLRKDVGEHLN